MEAQPTEKSDIELESARWESHRYAILAGLVLGASSVVVKSLGYGGFFDWFVIFAAGIGLAVLVFWDKRSAIWFWPAVSFLVIVHSILLLSNHWRILPLAPQMLGAAALDFGACALFLYGLHRLFDRRSVTTARWTGAESAIVWGLAAISIGIFGFAGVAMHQTRNDKIAQLETVFSVETSREMRDLMECIDNYRTRNEMWERPTTNQRNNEVFNQMWGRRIRIVNAENKRLVQVETVQGRPLWTRERELITRCVE